MSITIGRFVDERIVNVSGGSIIYLGKKIAEFTLNNCLAGESKFNVSREKDYLDCFSERQRHFAYLKDCERNISFSSSFAKQAVCEIREEVKSQDIFCAVCDDINREYADRFTNRRAYLHLLHYLVYCVGVPRWGKPV